MIKKLTPSSYESDAAKRHRGSIEQCIKSNFGLRRFWRTGSFGTGTSISGYSDVDYIASIPTKNLSQTEDAHRYLRAVHVEDAADEARWEHELDWQVLSLALEAWWREEISRGRLIEVGRLLDIDEETILDLVD